MALAQLIKSDKDYTKQATLAQLIQKHFGVSFCYPSINSRGSTYVPMHCVKPNTLIDCSQLV